MHGYDGVTFDALWREKELEYCPEGHFLSLGKLIEI
jgi:hypothetical protein